MSEEICARASSVPSADTGERSHAPRPGRGPVEAPQDALAEPSWGQVLWTTLRLWLQRRVLRRFLRGGGSATLRRRLASLILLVAVVFAAGALTVALTNGAETSSAAGRASGRQPPAGPGVGAAALARQQAAAWISAQVSLSATVACDQVMCSVLQAEHFPAGNLIALSPSAGDPLGSAIVVATEAVRSEFASRLVSVYAPVVIASFGSGTARVDVRVTAADGSRAYLAALHADLLARQASGQQLLGNQHLAASAAARAALAAGEVDSRLLSTLAVLAGTPHISVDVLSFGDAGPQASPGVPLRYAVIAVFADGSRTGSARYLASALSFLRAQRAPFRAASMTMASVSGQPVLRIQFAAPSPLGLLSAGSP